MLNENIAHEAEQRSHFLKYLDTVNYSNLPDHVRKQLHEAWRADPAITARKVQTALKLNTTQYYAELDRLGVPYTKKSAAARRRRAKLATAKKQISCCAISFSGLYDPQQLVDHLERIKILINPSAPLYKFEIKLEEKQEE